MDAAYLTNYDAAFLSPFATPLTALLITAYSKHTYSYCAWGEVNNIPQSYAGNPFLVLNGKTGGIDAHK